MCTSKNIKLISENCRNLRDSTAAAHKKLHPYQRSISLDLSYCKFGKCGIIFYVGRENRRGLTLMLELNISSNCSGVIAGTEWTMSKRALPTALSGAALPARTSSTYARTKSRRPEILALASAIRLRSVPASSSFFSFNVFSQCLTM